MFFEIENTPEHIRRARLKEIVKQDSPKEECPRLILAPFSRPPQVVFENVVLGSCCERNLEVFNPTKQIQQITLGRALPPGLVIHLPGEWLVLEPESCYCLTMMWTPTQLTALRETIRFTNESRGRYDVILVLKSTMNVKGKPLVKGYKISPPGKKKIKSTKRSPGAIYRKKSDIIYQANTFKKEVKIETTQHRVIKVSNKENVQNFNDYSIDSQQIKCPFDSPTSFDFNFDTSEIFSNMRRTNTENILQNTYDKSYSSINKKAEPSVPQNVLKPYNKQCEDSDIFDNLTFTPLKSLNSKNEKLDRGPKIIISMNSESDFDDSLDMKNGNNENEPHSIMTVTSSQPPNKWVSMNQQNVQLETQSLEPAMQSKKIPNTSSPKEFNSPNFSINTDFSRISDLSFFPQRHSTERKIFPKFNNETHEIFDDPNTRLNSDTFTKDSPNTPVEQYNQMYGDARLPHYFTKEQPKMCRQALFKDQQRQIYERNYLNPNDINIWHNDLRTDIRSPPRSITPPLQSIPEESTQYSDAHAFDHSGKQSTFTINRTFDKLPDRKNVSTTGRPTWSKKDIRAEMDVWKVPMPLPRKSLKPKASISGKESLNGRPSAVDKTMNQNVTLNQIGNIYSQSATVDPFLSATYFYDEEAVHRFEIEFKRWMNCILTPPADLDSNIELKIDVGKAWIENRNKEVPAAPTKEQVCSNYHNSHRLESLRRSARALLMSPENLQMFQKLNAQIEKKLIAIRNDRNLHLDVGLQRVIMELLLSYNPLWLRLGLEAIYCTVLPLKSNSDIDGMTTFIIQRMFKNPHLKNKHSKSNNAPNILSPAYMEAIKKFTLKKFFMLVFFLDQAKQRKLISHDPCLFCRNAVCKESREIIIRFTRELIAGIGDITKHLRPLGYVVCHKQSYLDEYKYAVHNLALDLRDGVRLTKVMEIILMKNGLLNQLRTPAISRLQKIHNVQVSLNALKEANFVIDGEITANDIADGHREKTLSLIWQLIHVFRAPLFEKAANVIQTWWRKKHEVIIEKRKENERIRQKNITAASIIQTWWRRIQYNRLVEWQMHQITISTVVIQKYCRMWLCRSRLRKLKKSTLKIEEWYKSVKLIREAKLQLEKLRKVQQELRRKSATVLQNYVRRWLCMKQYKTKIQTIVLLQGLIRGFLIRKWFSSLKKSAVYIQQKYRGKLLMRKEMKKFDEKKTSAIAIQSYYRMFKQRSMFQKLKKSVQTLEERYVALLKMRQNQKKYEELKRATIKIQSLYRAKKGREEYIRQKQLIVHVQRRIKAYLLMEKEKKSFQIVKNAVCVLQTHIRSYLVMKMARKSYLRQRESAITIQHMFRAYQLGKAERNSYLKLKMATLFLQTRFRALLKMRRERTAFLMLRHSAIVIQRQYRTQKTRQELRRKSAIVLQSYVRRWLCMKQYKTQIQTIVLLQGLIRGFLIRKWFSSLQKSAVYIQQKYRGKLLMRKEMKKFAEKKTSAIAIQSYYRMFKQRSMFQKLKKSVQTLKERYVALLKMRQNQKKYEELKRATIKIQSLYRAKKGREEYIRQKQLIVNLQKRIKAYLLMEKEKKSFQIVKNAVFLLQTHIRTYLAMKMARKSYLRQRESAITIQHMFRAYQLGKAERNSYLKLKMATLSLQTRFRALLVMQRERTVFLKLRHSTLVIQRHYRAQKSMKTCRDEYDKLYKATIVIQKWYRNIKKTHLIRSQYLKERKSAVSVQRRYRSILIARELRKEYLKLKKSTIALQSLFRMTVQRKRYIAIKNAALTIQRYYRSYILTVTERRCYIQIRVAIIKIQSYIRSFIERKRFLKIRSAVITLQAAYKLKKKRDLIKKQREAAAICIQKNLKRAITQSQYLRYRKNVTCIQKLWKGKLVARLVRCEFLQKRTFIIKVQTLARGYLVRKQVKLKKVDLQKAREEAQQNRAASRIQALFRGHQVRKAVENDRRVAELRRRWREGALRSTQESLKERNEEAMDVLRNMADIETVIRAFRSLELLTEVFPMMYNNNAASIVRRVYIYMSVTNRSISSIEVLKSAASVLVNLTRYKATGPKIYARERIPPILKFMWRFSNSETQLFCILCTYLWLFSKYDCARDDLMEFFKMPENHKMMTTIKSNVERTKRMASNTRNKFLTPQICKTVSHTGKCKEMNYSMCSVRSDSVLLPALDPDYGIVRADKPRYFGDAHQAITCLFNTFNL